MQSKVSSADYSTSWPYFTVISVADLTAARDLRKSNGFLSLCAVRPSEHFSPESANEPSTIYCSVNGSLRLDPFVSVEPPTGRLNTHWGRVLCSPRNIQRAILATGQVVRHIACSSELDRASVHLEF